MISKASNDSDQSRMRHLLSHAFSEPALQEQEPIISRYLDLMVSNLYERPRLSVR